MKWIVRLLLGLTSLFAIIGCTTPGNQPVAMDTMAAAVKSGMIKDGKTHVYVFLGRMGHCPNCDPTDLFINGVNVGGINKNECMFIELEPGLYAFYSKERTSTLPLRSQSVTFNLDVDQQLFLACDINISASTGMAYLPVGSSGGAVVPMPIISSRGIIADRSADGVKTIQGMKIILPDDVALQRIQPIN